jgi:hypothetical protein
MIKFWYYAIFITFETLLFWSLANSFCYYYDIKPMTFPIALCIVAIVCIFYKMYFILKQIEEDE